jgi:alpha-L-fucosidase
MKNLVVGKKACGFARRNYGGVAAVLQLQALALLFMLVFAGCPVKEDEAGGEEKLSIAGNVAITGFLKVGALATATSQIDGAGTLSYVWKRGDSAAAVETVIANAAGSSYTLTADDEGKFLTVTVSQAGYTGSKTSPVSAKVAASTATAPTVAGITVTPNWISLVKGKNNQFTAEVTGTGLTENPDYKKVMWSITTTPLKRGTAISASGRLTVGSTETKATLDIKAVSVLDANKFAVAAITVTDMDTGGELGVAPGALDLPQDNAAAADALNGWYKNSNTEQKLNERLAWFRDAKFGCFIHWGPYSPLEGKWQGQPYEGYAEHIQRIARIPVASYKEGAVKQFNPVNFNANTWMDKVKATGMKYFVITSKHHDGFAMWPSVYTPKPNYPSYDANQTGYDIRMTKVPAGRDLMMELKDAARARGIKFGFYYSQAYDWEHPWAAGNEWDSFNSITGLPAGRKNPVTHATPWWRDAVHKEFIPYINKYMEEKAIVQIEELLQKYEPDLLWFDTATQMPLYQNIAIAKAIRAHAKGANVVINGRLASWNDTTLGPVQLGDYENSGDRSAFLFPLPGDWESIPTTNESYGYSAVDRTHKQPAHFVRLLATAASKGGSILMNVGPKGDGYWDDWDLQIFTAVGNWLQVNGDSIYGTERAGVPVPPWGVITKKGNKLYVHVYKDWPAGGELYVGGVKASGALSGKLLKTGAAVTVTQAGNNLKISGLPAAAPDIVQDIAGFSSAAYNLPGTTCNTVIELTLPNGYTAHPYLALETNKPNILYTFDAIGADGFTRGDGKMQGGIPNVPNDFHLNDVSDSKPVKWQVNLREPKTFNITYNLKSGSAKIEVNGMAYTNTVTLAAGDHTIVLKPASGGTVNPRSITLTP